MELVTFKDIFITLLNWESSNLLQLKIFEILNDCF